MTEEEFKKNAKTIPINIEKEEKAAIDYFKYKVLPTTNGTAFESKEEHYTKVLLNLIEKLKKENEELKNKVVKRDNEIIELEETAEKKFLTKQELKENYIRKDKIRNFIEKHKDNFYDGTANGCDYIDYEVIKEFIEEE